MPNSDPEKWWDGMHRRSRRELAKQFRIPPGADLAYARLRPEHRAAIKRRHAEYAAACDKWDAIAARLRGE